MRHKQDMIEISSDDDAKGYPNVEYDDDDPNEDEERMVFSGPHRLLDYSHLKRPEGPARRGIDY